MKTTHPLPQSRASAAIRRRIWSREPCQLRLAHALPVAAARAPLRQQRHLEVRALGLCAFKWGAQLW
eukprot:scaffold57398_cov51-Phaeocystis_antarctica.AAC.1